MKVIEISPERGSLVESSFEAFFQDHFTRVYGILYRVTGNPDDAEDLAQEVFLQIARRGPSLWGDPAVVGWLWSAATHAALNALRADHRRREREENSYRNEGPLRLLGERGEDPAVIAERKAQQAEVRRVLRELKPADSALLLLRHAGLSYAEVAGALDVKVSSVGTLLVRAERRFKEKYDERSAHPY